MGTAAKRANRLQERSSFVDKFKRQVAVARVRSAVEFLLVHSVPARSSLCHRVVRRHGEERSGRLLP